MCLKMLLAMGFFLISFARNGLCDLLQEEDIQRSRYLEYVDDSDVTHLIDINLSIARQTSVFKQDSVKYLLFTRQNTILPQTLSIGNRDALKASYFNPNVSTVFIVHGWWGSGEKGLNPMIREAYLNRLDGNMISVDWSKYADNPDYSASVAAVRNVGRTLARFLEFLKRETGASYNDMHLIGYSLGAHVVGNCGRSLQGAMVARITGLDPAGPLWTNNPNRLCDTDAIYVEAIHTNGGPLGFGTLEEWGAANFYPNGGIKQPGCSISTCSHKRSYELFTDSLKYNNLIARKCSGITSMILDNCKGESAPMGNSDLRKSGSGIYRVDTRSTPPYSL